ncbi:MAG: ribulokinase [Solibacillus sp.]
MGKYTIGIDYGTQSGRAVLVSLADGKEIANHVTPYQHGVMTETLPDGVTKLENEWALQHPRDYIEVIENSIPAILKMSGVRRGDVIGIGIDFTACTMLPIDASLQPLCFQQQWQSTPHSWVKLWKHHAAQPEANRLNEIACQQNEKFLNRYGGKISSEWMIAKIWQILNEAPEVYEQTDQFVEATDWVISQLTGKLMRNSCTAGYKAIWHKQEGYPRKGFFHMLDSRLEHLTETKLRGEVHALGTTAGYLTESMASKIGLTAGIAVAIGNVDAHVAVPAVGVFEPGKMVMSMGTSICHMLLGSEERHVPGICGVVEDGIIPGFYGYEAGQSAVGDIFEWFVEEFVPATYYKEAEKQGLTIHQYLEKLATAYKPGESGLLALDWWNGNRSTLVDANLSGLILGMTLRTKPEEMYRALLEATAFGTKTIIDTFNEHGIKVEQLYACGGLPQKNKLLMQIYADVTNFPITIADSKHTSAVGSAMFAAVAAGTKNGGYDTIKEAAQKMALVKEAVIQPIPNHIEVYNQLYKEYKQLHDYFGKANNDLMKRLKNLRSFYN